MLRLIAEMRRPCRLLLLSLLLATARSLSASEFEPTPADDNERTSKQQPNLVFAMIDDWGFFEVGFRGNTLAQTPFIDKMIGESLLIERHYSYRYCSPARRSFLSGRLPPHVGQQNSPDATIDLRMDTIADKLAAAGYITGHSGKVSSSTMLPWDCVWCCLRAELRRARSHRLLCHAQWHAGFFTMQQTPHARGFSTSLGFLYGVDHWVRNRHHQICRQGVSVPRAE